MIRIANCNKWWSEAKRKYNFLLERKKTWKKEGPASSKATLEGHVKAWNQQKKNLMKILKKFQTGKCEEEFKLYVPARVYELAETEERVVYQADDVAELDDM